MSVNLYNNTSYGLNQALINTPLLPIQSNRSPLTSDFAPIGTLWCDKPEGTAYILVNIIANTAIWLEIGSNGTPAVITETVTTVDATPAPLAVIVLAPNQAAVWSGTIIAAPDTFGSNIGGTYQVSMNRAGGNISAPTNPIITAGNTIGGTSTIDFVANNPDQMILAVTGVAATTIKWSTSYSISLII